MNPNPFMKKDLTREVDGWTQKKKKKTYVTLLKTLFLSRIILIKLANAT